MTREEIVETLRAVRHGYDDNGAVATALDAAADIVARSAERERVLIEALRGVDNQSRALLGCYDEDMTSESAIRFAVCIESLRAALARLDEVTR